MRRKDREVTDNRIIKDFISSQNIVRIGLIDNGKVYISVIILKEHKSRE